MAWQFARKSSVVANEKRWGRSRRMSSRQLRCRCVVLCALAFLPAAATLARAEPTALLGQSGPIQLVALTAGIGGDPGMPPTVSELDCLALNIYWEARSEPRLGQIAVAAVTLNRVADPGFPDTVCSVVRQGEERGRNLCQFSWHCDGLDDRPGNLAAWQHAQRLAPGACWPAARPDRRRPLGSTPIRFTPTGPRT